jgi:hypothetical protein
LAQWSQGALSEYRKVCPRSRHYRRREGGRAHHTSTNPGPGNSHRAAGTRHHRAGANRLRQDRGFYAVHSATPYSKPVAASARIERRGLPGFDHGGSLEASRLPLQTSRRRFQPRLATRRPRMRECWAGPQIRSLRSDRGWTSRGTSSTLTAPSLGGKGRRSTEPEPHNEHKRSNEWQRSDRLI